MICENTYNQQFSRVRVRAHITGVLDFLLSQVSQGICKWLSSRQLGISQTYFNRQKEEVPKLHWRVQHKLICVSLYSKILFDFFS